MATLLASSAYAQTVPPAVEPGQIEKRFQQPSMPLESGDLGLPLPGQQQELSKAQKEKLEKIKFVLKAVKIEGATVYSQEQLKSSYEGMIGQQISLLDAQEIARKITALYQKDGYILSQAVVPQQEINNGTLKIRVVEGFVNGVTIQGEGVSESERALIASYLENVQKSRPVKMQDLERNLLLINDLPGAEVKGLLRPSAGQFGAADLVVTVTEKRFDGLVSLDNRGSKYIGPWQYSGAIAANSLLGLYDRTQLRIATSSPTTELRMGELQHEEMLGHNGTRLLLLASHTHTEPGDGLKNVQIVSDADLFEAKMTHPFIRSRQENLVGRASFDVRNSDTDVFNNTDFTEDRLRVVRLGGNYNFFDRWQANNFIDAQISQGLNIFNASESGTNRTNANGESDFTKLNVDASHLHPLPNRFSILAAASAQYSLDPLLVGEQFSLGGNAFGTAYDPAELLGDHGVAGKLELRYTQPVGEKYLNSYQLFGYYDIGRVWIRDGGAGANDDKSLTSLGGGIRTNLTDNLSASLEVDVPLTKPASNQGGHGNDPRVFFGATSRF